MRPGARHCLPPPPSVCSVPPRLLLSSSRRSLATQRPSDHSTAPPNAKPPPRPQPLRGGFFRRVGNRIMEVGAEKLNDPWAKVKYAMALLDEGRDNEAVQQLKEAAAKDQGEAMLFLAEMYREGKLVELDMNTSLQYYRKAAEKGVLPAMRYMALEAYEKGIDGIMLRDEARANKMLENAAALGDPKCMVVYGVKVLSGDGYAKDENKGIMYLEEAAEKAQDEASLALALYYRTRNQDGDGVRCVHWASMAAQQNPRAAMLMVTLLMEGKLLQRDMKQAVEHAVFAAGFEGEEGVFRRVLQLLLLLPLALMTCSGDAARHWIQTIERSTGKKLLQEEDEESKFNSEARQTWEEEAAIEEERMRRAAESAAKSGKSSSNNNSRK